MPNYRIIDKEKLLDYLIGKNFDPRKVVLLEKAEVESELSDVTAMNSKGESSAIITSYRPDHINLLTDSSEPGYLFLSEVFYPGWKASVDGKPIPVLRGNYLFRVVKVPKGKHQVDFVFDPLSIKIGVGVTVFTLLLVLAISLYYRRKTLLFRKQD